MYLKKFIIGKLMSLIKQNGNYDEIKLEEIQYGLVSIYLSVTKAIFIFFLAFLLGIVKEVVIYTIIYNGIRATSFGLHATKSWICLLSSTILFISIPYLCNIVHLDMMQKFVIGVVACIFIYKNSPADTHKRPIVSMTRRRIYQLLSTLIACIYIIVSLLVSNQFIANSLIFSLVVQCFVISPMVYRFFHLPYDNYKQYQVTLSS